MSWKDITENFLIYFTQFPLGLTYQTASIHLLNLKIQQWFNTNNQTPGFIGFHYFSQS
jgi:hypothetical protein